MRNIILLLALLLSVSLTAQPHGTDITLSTSTGDIYGTLLKPANVEKPQMVLLISGSGPTDRDGNNPMMSNNSLRMLAEQLHAAGIASVRFDKRGVAASVSAAPDEIDMRFDHYVDDVKAWIDMLVADGAYSSLTVAGHSEGALIATIAAQKPEVDRLILLAGAGTPADQTLRIQLAGQPSMIAEPAKLLLDSLAEGHTVRNVPPMLMSIFRPSVQPYMISWFQYDPAAELSKVSQPVLIVQGSTDIQVKSADADTLAAALPSAQVTHIEGMNHILKPAPADMTANVATYSDPELELHEDLMEVVLGFLQAD